MAHIGSLISVVTKKSKSSIYVASPQSGLRDSYDTSRERRAPSLIVACVAEGLCQAWRW
jgi:hypothetical protein